MKVKKSGVWKNCCYCGLSFFVRFPCHYGRKACSRSCSQKSRDWSIINNQYGTVTRWTEVEDRKLRKLHAQPYTKEQICEILHRTKDSVIERIHKLGLKRSPEVLAKLLTLGGKKNKGRKRPDFAKNAYVGYGLDNPFYGRTHSQETKEIISEKAKKVGTFKRLNKDPEFQRRRVVGLHSRPNYPEKILIQILDELFPGEYKYVGSGEFIVDGLNPDFINVNGQKKIIEVFGEQYHRSDVRKIRIRSTEHGRRKVFAKYGYKMLVIWSQEIFRDGQIGRNKLIEKLKEFHENSSN